VADQEGFPEAALNGLINGGLTKADNPTADNSLGLNIEYAHPISCRIDSFFS